MTSARLTNSTARDRFRLLRINSRRSGGANAILPRLTAASVQHITQLVTDLLHQYLLSDYTEVGIQILVNPFEKESLMACNCKNGRLSIGRPTLIAAFG